MSTSIPTIVGCDSDVEYYNKVLQNFREILSKDTTTYDDILQTINPILVRDNRFIIKVNKTNFTIRDLRGIFKTKYSFCEYLKRVNEINNELNNTSLENIHSIEYLSFYDIYVYYSHRFRGLSVSTDIVPDGNNKDLIRQFLSDNQYFY